MPPTVYMCRCEKSVSDATNPRAELANIFAGSGVKSVPAGLGTNFVSVSLGQVLEPFAGFGIVKIGEST